MLKNAFKKHPLQNRTNVQIKGPFEQCSKKLHFFERMASLRMHKRSVIPAFASEPNCWHCHARSNSTENWGFFGEAPLHGKPDRHCKFLHRPRDPFKVRDWRRATSSHCRKRKLAGTPLKLRLRWEGAWEEKSPVGWLSCQERMPGAGSPPTVWPAMP